MSKSRKHTNAVISNIKFLKYKYENAKSDIIRLTSRAEYEETIKHYDSLIEQLSKELFSLPIGYRYIGKFYLKKPYTFPAVFEEHYGAIYMREDLISWQIESGVEPPNYSYHRTIFKKPEEGFDFKREDAEPVYARDLKKVLSTV